MLRQPAVVGLFRSTIPFAPSCAARDASALETWRRLSSYLKFAESRPRALAYGNVGIVLDPAAANQDVADEYLKLAARRQVPYRVIARSEMNAAALANFRALVAVAVDPPSATERKLLQEFAENGGLVIAGPAWGDAPKTERFSEVPTGKGRVAVYRDPDPETVARDLKELLSDDELGVVPFNVPSVITFARGGGPEPLVVELVNYFDHPVEAITLRVAGKFRSAPHGNTRCASAGSAASGSRRTNRSDNSKAFVMECGFDPMIGGRTIETHMTRRDWLALSGLAAGAMVVRPAHAARAVSRVRRNRYRCRGPQLRRGPRGTIPADVRSGRGAHEPSQR